MREQTVQWEQKINRLIQASAFVFQYIAIGIKVSQGKEKENMGRGNHQMYLENESVLFSLAWQVHEGLGI